MGQNPKKEDIKNHCIDPNLTLALGLLNNWSTLKNSIVYNVLVISQDEAFLDDIKTRNPSHVMLSCWRMNYSRHTLSDTFFALKMYHLGIYFSEISWQTLSETILGSEKSVSLREIF